MSTLSEIVIDMVRHAESCANLLDYKLTDKYSKQEMNDKLKILISSLKEVNAREYTEYEEKAGNYIGTKINKS